MKLFKSAPEGSTEQLLKFSGAYFFFYVLTGLSVKYFQGKPENGFPGMSELSYLFYSTGGSALLCLCIVLALGWHKRSERSELPYIIISGICTAVVIPTTTLMYSLPISVMAAMVIMRGSIIFISRIVDVILSLQGISNRKIHWEENVAVLVGLSAVSVNLITSKESDFEFLHSPLALGILISYIAAYGLRIYLMNYFKNTRSLEKKSDNKGYFAVEQICASITLILVAGILFLWGGQISEKFSEQLISIQNTNLSLGLWAAISGTPFGLAAFFSVFLFMFKGRSSTFSGLVNRLTSLIAGTTSTLLFALLFAGKFPKTEDWISFGLILIAVYLLSLAEKKNQKLLSKK